MKCKITTTINSRLTGRELKNECFVFDTKTQAKKAFRKIESSILGRYLLGGRNGVDYAQYNKESIIYKPSFNPFEYSIKIERV